MFLSTRLARDERGSLAPSVAAIIIVLFLLGGLIIDGARALDARSRAAAYAEEGARIAGQAVTFDAGELELDSRAIADNADAYCARISAYDDGVESCAVNPTADGDIVFRVRLTIDKGILAMVTSDPTMTFVGEGRAIAEIGITEAQGGVQDPPDISGSRIIGNGVDPNVEEASDEECPPEHVWESADAPDFVFWEFRDYQVAQPHCSIPPICPNVENPADPVVLPRALKDEEITRQLVREEGEGWRDIYERCAVAENLLYVFKPADQKYCGTHPGEDPCPTPAECADKPGDEPLCPSKDDCLDDRENKLCPSPDECFDNPEHPLCPDPPDCDKTGPESPLCPSDQQCKDNKEHRLCPEVPPNKPDAEPVSSAATVDDGAVLLATGAHDRRPVSAWRVPAATSRARG